MLSKTAAHQYYFEVQLHWQEGSKGIITATDVKDMIKVATPPEFTGGVPDMWSPEHLFLSAISSCLMTTYLAIAEKRRLQITHFECNAIGHVALVAGHLEFVTVDLYPKIIVDSEEKMSLANEVLIKAYRHCIIGNSVKAQLVHHGEILQDAKYQKAAV